MCSPVLKPVSEWKTGYFLTWDAVGVLSCGEGLVQPSVPRLGYYGPRGWAVDGWASR